ncbi:hypothetical protein AMTR_s00005p00254620 [Amborella trichopoda]|uniref:Uncharacterized protein n=1 Tax=Amborella trichopoda TaxID=13333 RepID=W1PGY1_AMBTC|nr:hypothetical protein AMTR_s00005p00254620 [Amborella trichopoda]
MVNRAASGFRGERVSNLGFSPGRGQERETFIEVPDITRTEPTDPLAFVALDSKEENGLKDISRGFWHNSSKERLVRVHQGNGHDVSIERKASSNIDDTNE